jgi:hypothetical protein
MLHIPSAFDNATTVTVSGQYLAKNHLSARGRAHLAADILAGHVLIDSLTIKQLSAICRVSVPYIRDARKRPETLLEHFIRSTPEQWRECARVIGPAIIWDEMVSPLVT